MVRIPRPVVPALNTVSLGKACCPPPKRLQLLHLWHNNGMQTSGADRADADVEYRVVGGVSCGEADGCLDFYCVE